MCVCTKWQNEKKRWGSNWPEQKKRISWTLSIFCDHIIILGNFHTRASHSKLSRLFSFFSLFNWAKVFIYCKCHTTGGAHNNQVYRSTIFFLLQKQRRRKKNSNYSGLIDSSCSLFYLHTLPFTLSYNFSQHFRHFNENNEVFVGKK